MDTLKRATILLGCIEALAALVTDLTALEATFAPKSIEHQSPLGFPQIEFSEPELG